MTEKSKNPEIRDLGTHESAAVTLHETMETDKPVQINEPLNEGHPGRYDVREERFKTKVNGETKSL